MFLRTKTSLAQSAGTGLALAAFIALVGFQVTRVIGERDAATYRSRLETVVSRSTRRPLRCRRAASRTSRPYVENSQKAALDSLKKWAADRQLQLFVLDGDGRVALAPSSAELAGESWVPEILQGDDSGVIQPVVGGRQHWVPYANFRP